MKASKIVTCGLTLVIASIAFADSPVLVDANQQLVGFYAGPAESNQAVIAVSTTGYVFGINMDTGTIDERRFGPQSEHPQTAAPLLYLTGDCSGPTYFIATQGGGTTGYAVNLAGTLYYTPKGAPTVNRSIVSERQTLGSPCNSFAPLQRPTIPALLNDPAVTGLPTFQFVAPITLSLFDTWNDLFADSFEPAPV